ncbi:hypothetical protein CYMTET_25287 [Cymbomonas tetramitiformis]|uniref:Uncharacterized protein n=1 Tax=Cymbomonas tetramitiformis TaxID=36881 RepID=A0AAE0FU02_9CHLO|nr:hypothetical protein CYMTET_25287 [Cymbomonas tetramitiformis]
MLSSGQLLCAGLYALILIAAVVALALLLDAALEPPAEGLFAKVYQDPIGRNVSERLKDLLKNPPPPPPVWTTWAVARSPPPPSRPRPPPPPPNHTDMLQNLTVRAPPRPMLPVIVGDASSLFACQTYMRRNADCRKSEYAGAKKGDFVYDMTCRDFPKIRLPGYRRLHLMKIAESGGRRFEHVVHALVRREMCEKKGKATCPIYSDDVRNHEEVGEGNRLLHQGRGSELLMSASYINGSGHGSLKDAAMTAGTGVSSEPGRMLCILCAGRMCTSHPPLLAMRRSLAGSLRIGDDDRESAGHSQLRCI